MKAADEITEMVQGEGKKGGRIIFEGTPKKMKKTDTLTAKWLKEGK